MTKTEIDNQYIDRFISSMENDKLDWTISISAGMEGTFYDYRSPGYTNEAGVKTTFGFGSFSNGVWIDGHFYWSVPLLNPFTKRFWRFRRAKAEVQRHLKSELQKKYLETLKESM